MRGEYGIKQDPDLNEKLHPNMTKLHRELQARPKIPDSSHGLFLKTAKYNKLYNIDDRHNKKTSSPSNLEGNNERVKVTREPTADEYFDMIPDEPVNRDACA